MDNTLTILYSANMVDAVVASRGYIFANFLANVIEVGLLLALLFIARGQKGLSSGVGVVPTVPMEKPPQSGPNSTFVKGSPEDVGVNH